jgi:carbon-monoxide dehydrogenase large subunit
VYSFRTLPECRGDFRDEPVPIAAQLVQRTEHRGDEQDVAPGGLELVEPLADLLSSAMFAERLMVLSCRPQDAPSLKVAVECPSEGKMSFLNSRTRSAGQGFGNPVLRREDARLLTGNGRYSDDFNLPGQAYAYMMRSPHAHARIRRIDVAGALKVPGVIAVLTGEDAAADGLQPIPHRPVPSNPHEVPLRSRDGSAFFIAPHPPLPADRARFVGEAVAMVIAETGAAARDAAERVAVDYEPLPAVTATGDAAEADAPIAWRETSSNVCVDSDAGDAAAAAAAFRRAAHVVRLETWVQRVTGVPMEPRAALGAYDDASGRYTLYAGSGGVQRHQSDLAAALGVPASAVRVVSGEVGGNFGTRNSFYPEFALVAWAAKRLRRPVKWTCERREAFLTDYQGRDLVSHAELALDAQGDFLALRGVNTSNVGAHAVSFIPLAKGVALATSVYHVPAASIRARAVLSNTSPTTPYRSAGRPEVMFVMERLIDLAARRHGFDRVELRRRNLVPAAAMPYRNPVGMVYDSGDYGAVQDRAVALSDWAGFEARRAEARRRGRYRGIGLANYIELNSGMPRERAEITVRPEGRIDVVIGTLSAGQGHETSFAQLMAEWFGVDLDQVRLITGDTDVAPVGGGSHSGRSMRLGGVVMAKASDQIVDQGKRIAAWLLEAADADIDFSRRRFTVKGTDRSVDLFEVAAAALRGDAPEALRGPLVGAGDETMSVPSFPYGCAVCEVEVDPETGVVEIVRYTSVDDVGRAVNPMILHGQTHGGIAQGVGQALWERCHYDAETGQMLSATFMEYVLPRADVLPQFATEISEVPSTSNPLGLRGGGEGGTTPALGAVVNAIVDALAELGVEHIEMPATPERVWRAMQAAQR